MSPPRSATVVRTADDGTADDPLALDQQVCYALVVAARNVVGLYRPVLEPLGLTHPQYLVMLALWQRSPLSVKALSAQLQLDPGTLSPLLKRLEAGGMVTRGRDRQDERFLAVELTGAGRALRREALRIPPAIVARLGMSPDELGALHAALTRVIAASAEASAPDGAGPVAAASRGPRNTMRRGATRSSGGDGR